MLDKTPPSAENTDKVVPLIKGARRTAPLVALKQFEMVDRIKEYDPDADGDAIARAYVFAMKCHGGQLRASGDPYYSHPVEVATLCVDMHLDWQTICVALLHDTVEDTVATLDDIERLFGSEISRMVDGVTKLTRIEYQDEQSKQAENFRKLVLAMSADLRVLLVKLADRLHNMRTLHFLPKPDKRKRIARETMDIYAPLAARIGMQKVQDELEDIAFSELQPDAYHSITARLAFLREEGEDMAGKVVGELKGLLGDNGVEGASISGREKSPYSIWRKMQQKNVTFEQLVDIMAFRIVVADVGQCYQALGILHSSYHVIPGRFKDYISSPKPNGYQSLHTAVMGPHNVRIEVQIRTQAMHAIAEMGVAAHWNYKQGDAGVSTKEGEQFRWLRELVDIVENAQRPDEFLEHTKLELYQDQVFCFSPKGDVIALPRSATPVDFAYAVHSGIGDTCVGAKVNGRIVPLRTELKHGDQVEVITNKNSTPSAAWERFVVTGKARTRIRKYLRMQQREQYIALGKPMLQKLYTQSGVTFDEKALLPHVKQFQAADLDDLYANIGMSYVSPREVFMTLHPNIRDAEEKKNAEVRAERALARTATRGQAAGAQSIKGLLAGMAVHYARCCHPVPGDLIVGIVTTGKGVTIHTHDCNTLASFQNMTERWLDVAWDEKKHGEETIGRLQVILPNTSGAISKVTGIIASAQAGIANLKVASRTPEFYELLVDIIIDDLRHLMNVAAALRADTGISSVDRVKGR